MIQHPDYKHIEKLMEDLEGMQGNFKVIHDKLVERREKQYNEKQSVDHLRPGELVLYWRRRIKKGFTTKLLIDWQGPFEIIEKKTPVLYKIRTITNPQKTTHANIAHLSKIVSIADIPEDM